MCQERESVLYLPIKESESFLFSSAKADNPHSAKKSRKSPPPRLYYILGSDPFFNANLWDLFTQFIKHKPKIVRSLKSQDLGNRQFGMCYTLKFNT